MNTIIEGPVRFSHLHAYGRSAAHGLSARLGTEGVETYAMERGTAVHALVFNTHKVIGYGGVRRGKEYDAFAADHQGYEILTANEYGKAARMAQAVLGSSLAMRHLEGVAESTLLFRWSGQDCRVTPDLRGLTYITELKTCSTSDPEQFRWDALRRHYHAQLAYQRLGCALTQQPVTEAYIVAVESSEPYPVTVFRVADRALDVGDRLLSLWMERLTVCESSGHWPGYVDSVVELDTPDPEVELEY